MRRRAFLGLMGGAAAWPLAGRAQARLAHIGYLGPGYNGRENNASFLALKAGLGELGYVEGRDFAIEARWWVQDDDMAELARELVDLKVDVIVTAALGVAAAHKVTQTVPIVAAVTFNLVAGGLADSLAHPGGNVTGEIYFIEDLPVKRVALLKQAKPAIRRVGLIVPGRDLLLSTILGSVEASAKALGVDVELIEVADPSHCEAALAAGPDASVDGVVVTDATQFAIGPGPAAIAAAAQRHGLPAAGALSFAKAGGLIGFGVDFPPMFRCAAVFVDKILKGAKPGDIPIEQATKFVTVVNLKTAAALGLEIPPTVLAAADEVIE